MTTSNMERIYLIKNATTWMLDELIVFSQHARFKVLLIRKPPEFHNERLNQLKQNGIEVVTCPFSSNIHFKKVLFCLKFVFKNINSFFSGYSLVVGIKSIWWFLLMDDRHFKSSVSIHAQFATQPALVALLLSQYHHAIQVDYYFTFHAYDIFFNNRWFVKLVNNATKSFSISKYNIQYVLNHYKGLDPSKLELARLGAFSNAKHKTIKAASGLFHIGFISWFVEKKGIRYLLEAMENITARNKNIRLILAGDGPLRGEVEQYITSHQLLESVQYFGKLNAVEKEIFYSNLDAFVLPAITLPNDKDGIPVVLMEAVSYGLPIIATSISGIPEICIHNFNGFLIPEKNVAALVGAINALYNDAAVMNRFSRNSLKVFDIYNIESNSYSKLKKLNWIN